jgi:hypothetical protein
VDENADLAKLAAPLDCLKPWEEVVELIGQGWIAGRVRAASFSQFAAIRDHVSLQELIITALETHLKGGR